MKFLIVYGLGRLLRTQIYSIADQRNVGKIGQYQ